MNVEGLKVKGREVNPVVDLLNPSYRNNKSDIKLHPYPVLFIFTITTYLTHF